MTYRHRIIPGLCLAAALAFLASTVYGQANPAFKTLVQFAGTNGANPVSQPIQLPSGNLLGVTLSSQFHPHAPSTIYEVTNKGAIQNVFQLASDGSQGAVIENGFTNNPVVQASDGSLYGVMNYATGGGYGLVYRFTLPSTFHVLHTFVPSTTDCATVFEAMVEALDGNLYGMCYGGGWAVRRWRDLPRRT